MQISMAPHALTLVALAVKTTYDSALQFPQGHGPGYWVHTMSDKGSYTSCIRINYKTQGTDVKHTMHTSTSLFLLLK